MLLTTNNIKILKGSKYGYLSAVLHLAPGKLSGVQMCPNASPGCLAGCLNTTSHGVYASTQESRVKKTLGLWSDRKGFVAALAQDVASLERRAERQGKRLVIRLNGTSDVPWENTFPMADFPNVQFMDYTKSFQRMQKFLTGAMPKNYHLTFSRSELNDGLCLEVLKLGGTVAVVFDTHKAADLPGVFHGFRVIDGRVHDLRFTDPRGVVVGLSALGQAKGDTSGFVVPTGSAKPTTKSRLQVINI